MSRHGLHEKVERQDSPREALETSQAVSLVGKVASDLTGDEPSRESGPHGERHRRCGGW